MSKNLRIFLASLIIGAFLVVVVSVTDKEIALFLLFVVFAAAVIILIVAVYKLSATTSPVIPGTPCLTLPSGDYIVIKCFVYPDQCEKMIDPKTSPEVIQQYEGIYLIVAQTPFRGKAVESFLFLRLPLVGQETVIEWFERRGKEERVLGVQYDEALEETRFSFGSTGLVIPVKDSS